MCRRFQSLQFIAYYLRSRLNSVQMDLFHIASFFFEPPVCGAFCVPPTYVVSVWADRRKARCPSPAQQGARPLSRPPTLLHALG